jgi:NitT/TauT family transport system substrate-binding protein
MVAHRKRWWAWIALLPALLTTDVRAAETSVSLSLDYEIDGRAAPFLLPFDKGYYKAEGLNVAIEPASGSLETIVIFMLYNRPPFAVIGRKSRGVSQPKDLEGKILGAPAADGAYAQWPIFARVNNIDVSKVKIEIVSFPVREPMLAAGQVDAITGLSYFSYIDLKDKGVPVDDIAVLLMADYGVELYGNAIIVNSKFADEHPEAVKGFLVAFMKGLKETVKQPAMAIGSVLKRNADARKDVELERLTMAIRENMITPEVKANGYGEIDEQRFNRALEQMTLAYKFKAAKPKLEDIFDPSFLPPATVRKYN